MQVKNMSLKLLLNSRSLLAILLGVFYLNICLLLLVPVNADEFDDIDFFDMSLEELMLVNIARRASFSDIPDELAPASITNITDNDLKKTGARRLNEAMDILIPNAIILRHHPAADHLGIRGIVSDIEDKELLLVNGRLLNQHALKGAEMERDTPLLGDINQVDVIRGPSSSLYGAGALMGVINLQTYNSRTFKGSEVTVRAGGIEDYRMFEIKHSEPLSINDDNGIFIYYGIVDYSGADPDDAPMRVMQSYTDADGNIYSANEDIPASAIANDYSSLDDDVEQKFYLEYNNRQFDLWFRYLDTSQHNTPRVIRLINTEKNKLIGRGIKMRQVTLTGKYTWALSDWHIESLLSVDDVKAVVTKEITGQADKPVREKEVLFKNVMRREFTKDYSLALGLDISIEDAEHFKEGSYSYQQYSAYAEAVWSLNDEHYIFLGGRYDIDRFSDGALSPRLSWVWSFAPNQRLKTILSKSSRFVLSSQGQSFKQTTGDKVGSESLKSLEIRYEQEFTNHWSFGFSPFYNDHDVTGFDFSGEIVNFNSIVEYQSAGFELELSYHNDNHKVNFSHGYTELLGADMDDLSRVQLITTEPYGYGSDLNSWSNHITKFSYSYALNPQLSITTSLRIYWGFDGMESTQEFINAEPERFPNPGGISDAGQDASWQASYFLNLGAIYNHQSLSFRFDAHNVLGWFNEENNKRNFIFQPNKYRIEAPAFSLAVSYRF